MVMKLITISLVMISLLLTGVETSSAQPANSVDVDAVEAYLETQIQRHNLKGMAVAITQGDQIIYLSGFGTSGNGRPVTPQTPFFIGSVSKSFTALAVMQLVEEGLLDLDTPVQAYIPWFSTQDTLESSQITIRHLLNQTSGLSDGSLRRPFVTEGTTLEETVRHLNQADLTATPGTTFQYFNPNYNVLALVVEKVTNQSFQEYLVENIFEPLEMKNSFVELKSAQAAGLATGHNPFFGIPISRNQQFLPAELAAGFIISSVEDMANYLIAQNNEGVFNQRKIISADAITQMHTPPSHVEGNYAMGWVADSIEERQLIRHNGAVETFYADAILLPDHNMGISILINQNALLPLIIAYGPLSDGLIDVIFGNQPDFNPSMRLIYRILSAVVLLDFVRHGFLIARIPKWYQRVKGRSRFRQVLGISLQHLLTPILFLLLILMMLISAGPNAASITLLYFIPDISIWLGISATFSIIEAVLKFRKMAEQTLTDQAVG